MRSITSSFTGKLAPLFLCASLFCSCSTDDPDDWGLHFESSRVTSEDRGSLVVEIYRDTPDDFLDETWASIDYQTDSGTAQSGVDFEPTSGQLVWGEGDDGSRFFRVQLIDDDLVEGTEDFLIHFLNPRDIMRFSSPVTIKIEDDEVGGPAQLGVTLTYVLEIGEDEELRLVRVQTDGRQLNGKLARSQDN
ncbi:MAG: Calx-beta domain-containing protein [Planctomycetota bacterium]|jgi:hypothetical protein